ncbi:MAG: hypothetical protein LBS97_01495 [Treponema sp.]|nr:hypothetical protein [Treponema sp.]
MLILCEKPSVAKAFAHTLHCAAHKGFYHTGNMTIAYCVGHLFELCPPEYYNPAYKIWDIRGLPILPEKFAYRKKSGVKAQAGCVLALLKAHITEIYPLTVTLRLFRTGINIFLIPCCWKITMP